MSSLRSDKTSLEAALQTAPDLLTELQNHEGEFTHTYESPFVPPLLKHADTL